MKKKKHIQYRVIISAIIVLIIGQILNSVLSISSFENTYRSSLISKYKITSNELKRKIETSINFGIKINDFPGAEDLINNVLKQGNNIESIFITDHNPETNTDTIIYSTDKSYINQPLKSIVPPHNFEDLPDIPQTINVKQFEENLLKSITDKEDLKYIKDVYVKNKDKNVYELREDFEKKNEPKLFNILKSSSYLSIKDDSVTHYGEKYYIATPVYYEEKTLVGVIYIQFHEKIINTQVNKMVYDNFIYFLIVLVDAIVLLTISHFIVRWFYHRKDKPRKISLNARNVLIIVLNLIIAQLTYTYLNNNYFRELTQNTVKSTTSDLSVFVKNYIEDIFQKGKGSKDITNLTKVEFILKDIVENVPECREIQITDTEGEVQYLANTEEISNVYEEDFNPDLNQIIISNKLKKLSGIVESDVYLDEDVKYQIVAKNQKTETEDKVNIPTMLIEGEVVSGNDSIVKKVIDKDEVASIFQYVEEYGLVRISTNVKDEDGNSAIGTYIPKDNSIYEIVSNEKIYRGMSNVLGSVYLTAYKPIYGDNNKFIGVIAVGIKERDIEKVSLKNTEYQTVTELYNGDKLEGHLIIFTNKKFLDKLYFDLLMDALTVIAVSLIFSFQILIFATLFVNRKERKRKKKMLEKREKNKLDRRETIREEADKELTEDIDAVDTIETDFRERKYKIFRIAAFLFFLAEFIPLSFLPLFIKHVYEANPIILFGLSKEAMLGLPISVYMLGISISVLIAGTLTQKLKVKTSFLLYSSLLLIGAVLTAFSTNIIQLMIFRFISGLGYGGIVISGVNMIVTYTNISDRTTGYGFWFVGYSSANICAVPIGGVIASRLGYSAGMFVSGFFALLLILFALAFITGLERMKTALDDRSHIEKESAKKKAKFKLKDVLALFKNRSILSLLLFAIIPAQITFIGFFTYAFPLYMNSINISQANIGRLLTIYGIMLLFSTMVGRMADKYKNERIFIVIGNLILGIALFSFFFTEGVIIVIIAIIAIGIGDVLVQATKGSYITLAKEAREIGESKFSSIFLTFEKIGTIVAPIIAGSLIAFLDYKNSIVVIGVITIVGVILFSLLSKNLRKV